MQVTLVIVSHDRAFLDATTDEIILFRRAQLEYHTGNYSEMQENGALRSCRSHSSDEPYRFEAIVGL